MLIDTHAHLFWDSYTLDLDAVVERAVEAGLSTVINIGTDLHTSKQATDQTHEISKLKVYSSLGLHPHEGSSLYTPESLSSTIEELEKIYLENSESVVAIGECGLDFFFPDSQDFLPTTYSKEELKVMQRKLFMSQIELAKKLNLPLVIHCRDAWNEIFIPELQGTRGVFHTFTGSLEDAKKVLDLGYYLSFSCILTYPKNESLRNLIKDIPLDKILTETDSPFLPPQQIRGQRNEPAYVKEVVKVIAEVRGLSYEETAHTIYENAQQLFFKNLPR